MNHLPSFVYISRPALMTSPWLPDHLRFRPMRYAVIVNPTRLAHLSLAKVVKSAIFQFLHILYENIPSTRIEGLPAIYSSHIMYWQIRFYIAEQAIEAHVVSAYNSFRKITAVTRSSVSELSKLIQNHWWDSTRISALCAADGRVLFEDIFGSRYHHRDRT